MRFSREGGGGVQLAKRKGKYWQNMSFSPSGGRAAWSAKSALSENAAFRFPKLLP